LYRIRSLFNSKRLGLLLLIFGVMVFAAAPAMAQIGEEFEQEDVESGDVEPSVGISNTGDNANICAAIAQAANSGNVQNEQGVSQYLAYADDIEFEGSSIEISSDLAQECEQSIRQSAAAGAAPAARPGAAAAPGAVAKAGGAQAAAGPAGAAAPAVMAAAGAPPGGAAAQAGGGMLPKTGGPADIAPLVAAAGLLLAGGGLLAYRRFFAQ
jgi:LPXTG-motif cell wall-anchored protein